MDEKRKEYMQNYRKKNKEKILKQKMLYKKMHPWCQTHSSIWHRCRNPLNQAYDRYKNLEININVKDLKEIWFRDKAYEMKRPSIDRIDNSKGYTKENCRYLELSENSRRGGLNNRRNIE